MYYIFFAFIITLFLHIALAEAHPHFNDLKEIANSYPGSFNRTWGTNWDINNVSSNPCTDNWNDIRCNVNNDIVEIYLSRVPLHGPISPYFGNITTLTLLYLDNNFLNGSIPAELGQLSDLTFLKLQNNTLSGSIPAELALTNMTILYLARN